MTVERQKYVEFSKRIHQAVTSESRSPVTGAIEVTHRCNLTCSHCYNNLPVSDRGARERELSLEEHRRIIDEIADAGNLWLLYTGGEIFARADFLDIFLHAKKRGLLPTLFTNGTTITDRIADTLAEYRPFSTEVTLYGHTQEVYERLTRVPGSHARCRRGIERLLERGLDVKLKTVAISSNCHEIWDMRDFARDLGLEFKFDAMINPRLDCSLSPLAVRLTPLEVITLDLRDDERLELWDTFCESAHGPAQPKGQEEKLYTCGGAVNAFSINPYGELSLCTFSTRDTYDLRSGSFAEGWETFLAPIRDRPITRTTKCTHCHLKSMCGVCPAMSELENDDPEEPIDFLCHVAHIRAHILGLEIPGHGKCEYCPEGVHHETLMHEVQQLREMQERGEIPTPSYPQAMASRLPVLGTAGEFSKG